MFRVCTRPKEKVPVPIEQLGEQPLRTAAVLKWRMKSDNVWHTQMTIHSSFPTGRMQHICLFFMSHISQARQTCEVGSQWNFSRGRTEVSDQMHDKQEMQSWHGESITFYVLTLLLILIKMI